MASLLCVHGIAYGGEDYAASWQAALASAGVHTECVPASWPSTGTISGDVARIVWSRGYRARIVSAVAWRLEREQPRAIVAHSMGQPVAIEAAREVGWRGRIISIGGPLSHPVWGYALRAVGMGDEPVPGVDVVHLWNADDGVCCSPLLGVRHPAWIEETRIAVPGSVGWVREHGAELYLSHPVVASYAG